MNKRLALKKTIRQSSKKDRMFKLERKRKAASALMTLSRVRGNKR